MFFSIVKQTPHSPFFHLPNYLLMEIKVQLPVVGNLCTALFLVFKSVLSLLQLQAYMYSAHTLKCTVTFSIV